MVEFYLICFIYLRRSCHRALILIYGREKMGKQKKKKNIPGSAAAARTRALETGLMGEMSEVKCIRQVERFFEFGKRKQRFE